MIDLDPLYRRLEHASFSQRAQLAAELAASAPPDQLDRLCAGLAHPAAGVRLGILDVLRVAGHRPALDALLAHARAHDGDDRVFALRALAELARPGDAALLDAARGWLTAGDPFVATQAARVVAAMAPAPAAPASPPPRAAPGPAAAGLERVVVAAFAASTPAERLARVAELEGFGPAALAAAARLVLKKGDADLVTYVARALIRHAADLPAGDGLAPLLQAARRRVGGAPATDAALDDALVALAGPTSPAVLARVDRLDRAQQDALAARLCTRPPEEAALAAPVLLDALAQQPAAWTTLGPALAHGAGHVRPGVRADLRRAADRVIERLRAGERLPAVAVVAVAWVLARIAEPGEPMAPALARALERLASPEAARATAALCVRLATEEAAAILIAMTRDPLAEARTIAREAIAAWRSPTIELAGDPPAIVRRPG